jgi:hypothetical protein
MMRNNGWKNLNGFWEFQEANAVRRLVRGRVPTTFFPPAHRPTHPQACTPSAT